jgi:hypothetical protein
MAKEEPSALSEATAQDSDEKQDPRDVASSATDGDGIRAQHNTSVDWLFAAAMVSILFCTEDSLPIMWFAANGITSLNPIPFSNGWSMEWVHKDVVLSLENDHEVESTSSLAHKDQLLFPTETLFAAALALYHIFGSTDVIKDAHVSV